MPIRSRENLIGAWAFLLGIILAILAGLFATFVGGSVKPSLLGIVAVLGLLVGFFVAENDVKTFLLATVSLVVVSFAGIQGLVLTAAIGGVKINPYINNILGALMFLFIPSSIVVALKTVFSIAKS